MNGIGPAEREVLLALADDEHLMGQRHTEWIGVAPFIEEDLAFASIGQDELGHAAMLYELLGDAEELAFGREADEYRSCWLVEAPCTDWADALVRHFVYDEAEHLRWEALRGSTVDAIAAAAERAVAEERYHRRHANALLDALWGEPDARARLDEAYARLAPLTSMILDGAEDADPAVVGRSLPAMWADLERAVVPRFGSPLVGNGVMPADQARRTRRSPHFAEMYARMREVLMLDPTARW